MLREACEHQFEGAGGIRNPAMSLTKIPKILKKGSQLFRWKVQGKYTSGLHRRRTDDFNGGCAVLLKYKNRVELDHQANNSSIQFLQLALAAHLYRKKEEAPWRLTTPQGRGQPTTFSIASTTLDTETSRPLF